MSDVLSAVLSLAFAAQVVHIATPYALAAMGGSITERSGVIDLALEGKLLFGAFAAAAVAYATNSVALGILAGMAAGALTAALQIACSLWLRADQVIVGISLNMLGSAGTRLLLQLIFGEGASSPRGPGVGDAVWTNPLVWLAIVAAAVLPFALRRTRWGVRLRAAGDRPDALISVGASPLRARLAAAMVGGALAGAGGAHLSLSVGVFVADHAAGRGYIALAMVILSGWRPAWAMFACVGVAVASALGNTFQVTSVPIAQELLALFPYVATLAVLIAFGSRRPPPRSLGQV